MIRFTCPKCGKHLRAAAEHAGKQSRCGRCGDSVQVPATSSNRVRLAAAWGVGVGLLFAGVALAVFLRPGGLDQQLSDLKSSDPAASRQALDALAQASPTDAQRPRVTAALETLLLDGDVHKELSPDLVLRAYLSWAGPDNVPAMIRMVEAPTLPAWNSRKTGMVMEALARLHDERACGALAGRLTDPRLRDDAVTALEVMGPRAESAVLEYLFDPGSTTRDRAAKLLADFRTSPQTIYDKAVRRLQSPQAEVRRGAVAWLADNAPGKDAPKETVARLLAKQLEDLSPEVCNAALRALKHWATADCLPQLLAYARREQKNAAGNPLLIDVLAQFSDESAAGGIALQLLNGPTRGKAVQALLTPTLRPVADRAVLPYLNHPDVDVRKAARDLCRRLGVSTERQLEQTIADIADTRLGRNRAALEHLARLKPDNASRARVSRALNAPLLDANAAVRDTALDAVKVWGSPENTQTLLQLLGDGQAGGKGRDVRIMEALGALKDPKAAAALAQGLTHDRERRAAGQALTTMGPVAEEAILPFLRVEDREARCAACRILAEIGTDKSLQPLREAGVAHGFLDEGFFRDTQLAAQKIQARK
jgi:hypothetical protein